MINIYQGDCLEVLPTIDKAACIFADPPDNIGGDYATYDDGLPPAEYFDWLFRCLKLFCERSPIVWLSFNAQWTQRMGVIVDQLFDFPHLCGTRIKTCVQVFTFGQHRQTDLGNNHRPLWRFAAPNAVLYPDNIRIPSWRQRNGDKRASPKGRVPGDVFDMQPEPSPGDVFDFPRVTGNSKQRCDWHPTQLHEELVERCVLLSTQPGDHVIDPFAGTGTTGRACAKHNRNCSLIDIDETYCQKMRDSFLAETTTA
jgi:adenine-specific DNA-methyltransferase